MAISYVVFIEKTDIHTYTLQFNIIRIMIVPISLLSRLFCNDVVILNGPIHGDAMSTVLSYQ